MSAKTKTAAARWITQLAGAFLAFSMLPANLALAQVSYQAQIRGVVTDASGAVVTNATVTVSEVATGISRSVQTDSVGYYIVRALTPSSYVVHVSAPGFQTLEEKGIVLQVDQETSLNFTLRPAGTTTSVQVTEAAPLLDTESSSLGTDVTSQYVKEIPLLNRNFFGLVFLNAGVSEVAGSGVADNYPTGTNFVSNGQRNATAEIRVDGALITSPEQGEGGNTNVYYEPSVEVVQEFKVQNNSFSSEFGSNGGTVVNMALKSGTNAFHGSAWWFTQHGWLDANDFFSNQAGLPRPDHSRNQYGFSLGGPIKKDKAFFFIDLERVLQNAPVQVVGTVPTALERQGDFSQTMISDPDSGALVPDEIFNPFQVSNGQRASFSTPNVIDAQWQDAVGKAVLNLYPLPTPGLGNPDGTNNLRTNTTDSSKGLQFDIKLDGQVSANNHLSGRYSHAHSSESVPTILGDDDTFADGDNYLTTVHNASLQHDWTIRPTLLLSSRFAVEHAFAPGFTTYPSASSVGFPSLLDNANAGISRMPGILVDSPWTSLYDQCCVDTKFAHTLYSYSSGLSWVHGKHNFKFGGEQRIFFNNFQQPSYPTGYFHFAQEVTEQVINAFNPDQGNPFADIMLGVGDYGGIAIYPEVFDKSKETAFYVQDDWKVTPKLTLNLGLRYEWSTPYSERNNHLQFSDFSGDSGVSVDLSSGVPELQALGLGPTNLIGTTEFPTSSRRTVPVDRNNWAPRLGFAYQLTPNTVVRGGAGVYYGMNVATNFQYAGTAFRKDGNVYFTKDDFQTLSATLENPFPAGLPAPEGTQYGPLSMWGYQNINDLGTSEAQNADIYQWSLGVQRLLPGQFVVSVDYSANRSIHLPWGGAGGFTTRDRNFISSALRSQFNQVDQDGNPLPCNDDGTVNFANLYSYSNLHCNVPNPFQSMFVGPNAVFNQPDSLYNDDMIPLINLLRPFPQFDGNFEGLPLLEASSFYNALQVRFQKRASHYISFEGSYTFSRATDDSSAGRNAWIGSLGSDNPQELDDLQAEHSISANDATHRLALAIIADTPIGRGRWIGNNMNRALDAIVGGWTISTILTFQSGQPLDIGMSEPTLDDGNQRPNVLCNPRSGVGIHHAALTAGSDNPLSVFNADCFADPGFEQAGDSPRYFSILRSDGIHNMDVSLSKSFTPREGMTLELRGEFFNFLNTPRFAPPDTLWGDSTFGQISSLAQGSTPRHGQLGIRLQF
ncbi:MAG TPA: TonB-dependent receptor [Terriglobales bacterium]|nr:TonB-dependent receptor [Terriglobales bacterium]